ncbi:TMV resistance N-like [Chlorella sorokiniana]|uniref:TMV resistance N-like n=1 Tax=Chlorella sorokiniana TaxID=3076 RepID=A0A2P6TES3_CHLSO|nr:TMV resistance N-like [Chlorella sorokiniana]|eukprot:PRW21137.1 TMV resistance N-like [Chlorella sorokiniana]
MPALDSAADWLAEHGHHIRKLCIAASAWEAGGDAHEAVAYALEAVGAARQLKSSSDSMGTLSVLRSLELSGASISLQPGARLPPSITRLAVCLSNSPEVLEQIAQLPQLRRLQLRDCYFPSDDLSRLSSLAGSLTRLDAARANLAADGLAALTRLQHLNCFAEEHGAMQAIEAALPHLTGLTCLELTGGDWCRWLLPASVDSLPQLELCLLDHFDPAHWGDGLEPPLPGGPWLASLRWLAASVSALVLGGAGLQEAAALEHLDIEALTGAGRRQMTC